VTSTPQPPSPAPTAGQLPVREAVGLVLVVLGAVSLSGIAFAFNPLLGGALVSVLLFAAGLWLCSSEDGA
jgi:hypothetical protein